MADKSITQTIKDAEIDARSLSEFISKDDSFTVTRRLAPTIHTLDYYLLVLNNVKEKGDLADIAISDTLDKLDQLEPTVIQRVEDAINNTAVEGGVLADTFVTVTANGVGTVPRTQRDKNSDFISVKDFGAVGDGETLNHLAIQAAVDYCSTHNKTLYIPDGVYLVDGTHHKQMGDKRYHAIALKDNTHINLSSGAILKVQPNSARSYGVFRGSDVSNISIRGGTLLGEKLEHTFVNGGEWGHGIRIEGNSSNILLEDVTIKDCMGDCISFSSSADYANLVIRNCNLLDARRHELTVGNAVGIKVIGTNLIKSVAFDKDAPDFNQHHTSYGGLNCDVEPDFTGVIRDFLFSDCKFISTANACLRFDMRHAPFDNVTVRNNYLESNSSALSFSYGSRLVVEGNTFKKNGSPGGDSFGTSLSGVTNFSINSNKATGFYINIRLSNTTTPEGLIRYSGNGVVSNNSLGNQGRFNLTASTGSHNITIQGNSLGVCPYDYSGNFNLSITGVDNFTISDNVFEKPEDENHSDKVAAYIVDSTNMSITGNIFNGKNLYPVQIRGEGSTGIEVLGNIFKGSRVSSSYSVVVSTNTLGNVVISNNVTANPSQDVTYQYIYSVSNADKQRENPIIITNNTTIGRFARSVLGAQEIDKISGNSLGSMEFDNSFKAMDYTSKPANSLVAAGYNFFATDLGKVVYFNGTTWVDATGTEV